jgi:hypothetical protein
MLKASHGSGMNLRLTLPEDLPAREAEIRALTARWLAARFGHSWGEWQYGQQPPRLLLERYIEIDGRPFPADWRFFVFHGQVRLAQHTIDRETALRTAYYTPDWRRLEAGPAPTPPAPTLPRPDNLAALIETAERLAQGLDFVRVDLYSDGVSRIRFGELTLTPNNANVRFTDFAFDHWLGRWFDPGATA